MQVLLGEIAGGGGGERRNQVCVCGKGVLPRFNSNTSALPLTLPYLSAWMEINSTMLFAIF